MSLCVTSVNLEFSGDGSELFLDLDQEEDYYTSSHPVMSAFLEGEHTRISSYTLPCSSLTACRSLSV